MPGTLQRRNSTRSLATRPLAMRISPTRTNLPQRGFTLFEMLVVIGIISVIVGLLVPGIRTVQSEAHSVRCRSNLRNIGQILDAQRQQRNGLVLIVDPLPAVTPDGPVGGLPEALEGFVSRTADIWLCPADFDEEESVATGTSYAYVPGILRFSPPIQLRVVRSLVPLMSQGLGEREIERRRLDAESREVTGIYRTATNRIPLVIDSADRHFTGREPRNAVFWDGSVDAADEVDAGDADPDGGDG